MVKCHSMVCHAKITVKNDITVHRLSFFTTKDTKNHEGRMKSKSEYFMLLRADSKYPGVTQSISHRPCISMFYFLENFVVLRALRGEI
jgi:hypothetical protein